MEFQDLWESWRLRFPHSNRSFLEEQYWPPLLTGFCMAIDMLLYTLVLGGNISHGLFFFCLTNYSIRLIWVIAFSISMTSIASWFINTEINGFKWLQPFWYISFSLNGFRKLNAINGLWYCHPWHLFLLWEVVLYALWFCFPWWEILFVNVVWMQIYIFNIFHHSLDCKYYNKMINKNHHTAGTNLRDTEVARCIILWINIDTNSLICITVLEILH